MSRRRWTLAEKRFVLDRQGHRCAVCRLAFQPQDEIEFDHTQALGRGGADEIDNLRAIHRLGCHSDKTREDVREIAKTKRLKKKWATPLKDQLAAKPPGRRLRGRG